MSRNRLWGYRTLGSSHRGTLCRAHLRSCYQQILRCPLRMRSKGHKRSVRLGSETGRLRTLCKYSQMQPLHLGRDLLRRDRTTFLHLLQIYPCHTFCKHRRLLSPTKSDTCRLHNLDMRPWSRCSIFRQCTPCTMLVWWRWLLHPDHRLGTTSGSWPLVLGRTPWDSLRRV